METWTKVLIIIAAILVILTGCIVLVNPVETIVTLAFTLGLLILASGVVNVIAYISKPSEVRGSGFVLFDGLASILVGVILLFNQFTTAEALPYLFAFWIGLMGIERIVDSIEDKKMGDKKWYWSLILGIVALALGLFCFIKPIVGAFGLVALVGVGLIVYGISMFVTLYRVDKLEDSITQVQ